MRPLEKQIFAAIAETRIGVGKDLNAGRDLVGAAKHLRRNRWVLFVTDLKSGKTRDLTPIDGVQVQIQDTSLADAPAEVIGEQIIENPGQVPIPYEVCYDPSVIQENHSYSMSARITDGGGNLMWINDTNIPVITQGNPTEGVVIPVVQVSG